MTDAIHAGGQVYERWVDLEVVDVQRQLTEIDPNLVLVKAPTPQYPKRFGAFWNGPDGQWHGVCFHNHPTAAILQQLPHAIRMRDAASPVNSRESAFERDVKAAEKRSKDAEEERYEQLVESSLRVYHGFGKDTGHGRKSVSLRPAGS
jgi:hypothetical protein